MKNIYFIIVFVFLSFNTVFAQRAATHTITNFIVNTSTNKFSFDIYSQSTGTPTLYVGLTSFLIFFNNTALNTPVLSYINPKYTTGSPSGDYNAMAVQTSFGNEVNVTISFSGAVTGFGQQLETVGPLGERICTVTLNIINQSATALVSWDEINSEMQASALVPVTNTFVGTFNSPLPVELSSFTASSDQNAVNLKWQTATEVNNYGFEVERSVISNEERNLYWQKIGFVNGNGNSNSPKTYSFSDNNPNGGSQFLYRLKQIDNDGQFEYSEAVEVMVTPVEYNLYQNYPNPFNPTTKIKFALPEAGKVVLKIYDMTGAEVAELVNTDYEAGYYDIELNASNLASGVYLYRLQSNSFTAVKKLMLIK